MICDIFISVVCFEHLNNLHTAVLLTAYEISLLMYFLDQLCVFMPLKKGMNDLWRIN